MHNYEDVNILNNFLRWPHSFTPQEILDFSATDINLESIQLSLINDPRFIHLSTETPNKDLFISKSTLFQWFCAFNIRLAEIRQFRLSERHVALAMSHLRTEGYWRVPPNEAVQWGQSLGFITHCYTQGYYAFPLARAISFMSPDSIAVVKEVLKDLNNNELSKLNLKELSKEFIKEGFLQFSQRVVHIVQSRAGISRGKKMTFEELGRHLGITRARVQQIENQFWAALLGSVRQRKKPFLAAFLCDFMSESGSLVVEINSFKAIFRKFLARCANVPLVKLSKIGLLVLAALPKEFESIKKSPKRFYKKIDADIIANQLESKSKPCLAANELKIIAERVAKLNCRRMNKAQKVYLALRTIGKPAHYSKVTEVYSKLFPDFPTTEHNIHAILSRQQYGVVWIGLRGTFALKEWGYRRPSKPLFDTVTDIVKRIYKQTGKPVTYTTIIAEIGKYRKVCNPSSLFFAVYFNPNLKCVNNNSFVMRSLDDSVKDEISSDQLDKILQEFKAKCNRS